MSELILSRLQFGVTTSYHFLFVPLTLGLAVLIALMETWYVKTGDETYKKMTKFWGKLFLINFAMGVATGLVQEFQFGMNWSEYSRFMGDIFGAPLAIEALLAFFIESTFLGVWIFGWDKLSKKVHLLSIWLVAIAGNLSALWILIANSFMQEPVGYVLRNGRAEMVDFLALITNPHIFYQFPHTVLSGFTTAAFFVLGISAYHLLKKQYTDIFLRSAKFALVFGIISVFGVTGIGHSQGMHLVESQPMKMAATEAHWETEDPAGLSLLAIVDNENKENSFEIKVPRMLSFMSYGTFTGEVKGINDLQEEAVQQYGEGNYVPPVTSLFWSFRIMVGVGSLLVLVVLVGAFLFKTKRFANAHWFLRLLPWMIPLPYLANLMGWYMTEAGRQPWIVYGLQKTADGVSTAVSAGYIWTSLIGFTLLYGILAIADVYLILKFVKRGPVEAEDEDSSTDVGKGASLWT
ncbi:cytochrome bd-type quinol oxidase, subunit 1 [Desulfitobacterium dichloroeliminans LMG P-21439]|uniref:Cytochrome bd-type quinol oxidase, subunit 1 n=1 Tax=Desulfitobacterium dichloroeliminans (strain LMG P-21439 / DCA1) TaxID=871963 RepID=L0F6B3_DESDL|nr:cytochrome ubiquinol oxidase subunit I [Desulfitobacterium dichloroeliminans]AGA68550.1 cytochrome bd-type quinol oxidase, subunit 1 [Desulfitobacterium dichloroeliminans LMG P-21439]